MDLLLAVLEVNGQLLTSQEKNHWILPEASVEMCHNFDVDLT